ncbi:MAG: T9SS type A sorting domain-containing protein [Melioribacteraceae bacterium]|nr:T9SS type A sorting domain-containing protein [Melioribacteraceae bacterium]
MSIFSVEIIAQKEEGTLPVELIYFRAFAIGDTIWLQWGTATETNNYGFSVQRSNEEFQWEELGIVLGHVNSFSPKHYEFWDTAIPIKDKYFYRLEQIDIDGKKEYSDTIVVDLLSSVIDEKEKFPTEFILHQNYPNPFNPITTIRYSIPNVGIGLSLSVLKVYDVLGREVATLVNEPQLAGNYEVKFNSSNTENGPNLTSGVYFYKLQSGNFIQTRKFILMK